MDWISCKKGKFVKEVKTDKNLIVSLIKSSSKKLNSQSLLKLNNDTATSKISLVYEALRELLEALAINNNFKIYNHECYCHFLKEVLKEDNLAKRFNNFRILRNHINYYGKDINEEEAKILIEDMMGFIKEIKRGLNK